MTQLHVLGEKRCSRQPGSLRGSVPLAAGLPRGEEASPLRGGSVLWQRRSDLPVAGEAFV